MRRRLRKKLRRGEFVELGFAFEGAFLQEVDVPRFVDAAIDWAESRGLLIAVGTFADDTFEGYVTRHRGSCTEADRLALRDWVSSHPATVAVDHLSDAWRG